MAQLFLKGINNVGNPSTEIKNLVSSLVFPVVTGDLKKSYEKRHGKIGETKIAIAGIDFNRTLLAQTNGTELVDIFKIEDEILIIFERGKFEEVSL